MCRVRFGKLSRGRAASLRASLSNCKEVRSPMKFLVAVLVLASALPALAQPDNKDKDVDASACKLLPTHSQLKTALASARAAANGGFNLDMWGTVVNRDGVVCAVAFTGADRGSQWPGSRVISAQKANTANGFSLPAFALSTANLYYAVSPGGT